MTKGSMAGVHSVGLGVQDFQVRAAGLSRRTEN